MAARTSARRAGAVAAVRGPASRRTRVKPSPACSVRASGSATAPALIAVSLEIDLDADRRENQGPLVGLDLDQLTMVAEVERVPIRERPVTPAAPVHREGQTEHAGERRRAELGRIEA